MEDKIQIDPNDFLPLRDVVFKTLRKAILTGQLQPGERLMEVHLANRLGVSRTPIREAIRKLELEGLVIMIPRRGAEVAEITEKSLKDVLEVRRALDMLCAELACDRITEEEMEKLKEACEHFAEVTKTEDLTEIAKADVALHDILIEATGNQRLQQMINNLAEQMYRYRFVYIKDVTKHDVLIKEHTIIYEAVKDRDKEKAAQAAKMHIDHQEESILGQLILEKKGRVPAPL